MRLKFLVCLLLCIFCMQSVLAACTVTLDKESYVAGETATAAMSCSTNPEKNTAYTLNWTNQSGYQFEIDTGTTPSVAGQIFYQSYTIPSTWPDGVWLNASLNGTGLTVSQNDSANVTASAGSNALVITNVSIGGSLMGLVSSIDGIVKDENGKKISGGLCKLSIWSNDETRMMLTKEGKMFGGETKFDFITDPTRFEEGVDYATKLICYCGSFGSENECIDEDGNSINNSVGEARNSLTVGTWLYVNTVTDRSLYQMKEEIFICANVTNVNYSYRIHIPITYQVRCSAGIDNDNDLDRVLIIDDYEGDERGISNGTTQMQCKRFIIPESKYLQGRDSQCYASTEVSVVDKNNEEILSYYTTSPLFNVTSDELNIIPDWERINETSFNAVINLSASKYDNYNGTGTGNIDLKLYSFSSSIASDMDSIEGVDFIEFLSAGNIQNVTALNSSGGAVTWAIEILEDGSLEIELRDVDISPTGYYNITLDIYNFDQRQTEALEGIENKTGTFHLDVDCPSQGLIGGEINCSITAQVEDSQIVQKEVDFTCYIDDGLGNQISSLNFNQMVTKTSVTLYRTFAVPSNFTDSQGYVLQCTADYYNLGSRRDSFYDTFIAVDTLDSIYNPAGVGGGTSYLTGAAVASGDGSGDSGDEGFVDVINKFNPFSPKRNWGFIFIGFVFLAGLGIFGFSMFQKKTESISSNSLIGGLKVFGGVVLVLTVVSLLVLGAVYGYSSMKATFTGAAVEQIDMSEEGSYVLFQGSLSKAIYILFFVLLGASLIIILFSALLVFILSKLLNIRGEIKLGHDYSSRKFYEDKKTAKLQHKLNRMVLKEELRKAHKKK